MIALVGRIGQDRRPGAAEEDERPELHHEPEHDERPAERPARPGGRQEGRGPDAVGEPCCADAERERGRRDDDDVGVVFWGGHAAAL